MAAPPSVQSFMLADQVFRQADTGKWCLIGIFNGIRARQFPAVHPALGLYLKLSDAEGQYAVHVELQDDQGQTLARLQGLTLTVPHRLAEVEVGLQGFSLPLPRPGVYFLKVFFNDELAKDIRLEVSGLDGTAA